MYISRYEEANGGGETELVGIVFLASNARETQSLISNTKNTHSVNHLFIVGM